MMTIREYAAEKGISYEAVRRQVARYSAELEGHIEKQGKMQLLDDFAVAFLDEHRAGSALAVYKADAASELKRLQRENKELSDELRAAYRENSMLSQAAAESAKLLAEAKQTQLALTASEEEKKVLEVENEEIKALNAVLSAEKAVAEDKARQEAEAAQKAQQELTDAHTAFEEDLRKKNGQIQAWGKYAADLQQYLVEEQKYHEAEAAYQKRWFKKKKDKPVPPVPPIPPDMLEE